MLERELVDDAVRLLGTAIGIIMEDHAESAISGLSANTDMRFGRIVRLKQAGTDITCLAEAAAVLLRLNAEPRE